MANSSEYIETQRKEYALYVLENRALAMISDGLKNAGRRVLWTAKSGEKFKTATLAGATMPIHPHAAPDGIINTLAAPNGNNICLFKGIGAFGTKINPTGYGSSRYTSVKISKFTKEVLFKDIEIIPLKDNYDQTLKEPLHFLPLVPISLINPSSGIAIGFASSILPRDLENIIKCQILFLKGKSFKEPEPYFRPLEAKAVDRLIQNDGSIKWKFKGTIQRKNSFEIIVSNLPYNLSHDKFISNLGKLEEKGFIKDFIDNSSSQFDILVKFPRGYLNSKQDDEILKKLGLITIVGENLVLLDFDGKKVLQTNYIEIISSFTKWRLSFYIQRYERLLSILRIDIQKYKDIIVAIDNNVGSKAIKLKDRNNLKIYLDTLKIVYLDYIADLSVYRFTEEEKKKVQNKLNNALILEQEYIDILSNNVKRQEIYIKELKEVLSIYKRGLYDT